VDKNLKVKMIDFFRLESVTHELEACYVRWETPESQAPVAE